MRLFPKIDSPCPYKGNLEDIIVGDMCRLCHKQVFDLTDMAEDEKKALLASCAASICVRYKLSARSAIAAAAIGASLLSLPAAAGPKPPAEVPAVEMVKPDIGAFPEDEEVVVVLGGGIEVPEMAQWVGVDGPAMPVEVDDVDGAPEQAPIAPAVAPPVAPSTISGH